MALATTKSTVMAIIKETTEGTLVLPSAGTDFVPMQPDVSITPNIESLENEEIRSSIGRSKPIQGLESPEASFSLYVKHSGVEGQAPNYGELLEACWGSVAVQATERTLTTGSTTSVVNLASGGSDYSRGKAVLLKDGLNGYQIRPVQSVSSNNLTLGFNLAVAPLTGVTAGKFVNYSPANAAHPSISVIRYNGAGHSVDALAGGKVTEFAMESSAGELINASYTLAGTKYFFDPIEITSSTEVMDFNIGGSELSASVAVKIYRTPHELASALQTAMVAAGGTGVTVVYSNVTGKFTIAKASGTLSLLWNTGTNAASSIGTKLGYSVAANDTGGLSYLADNAISYAAPYSVSFDAADPLVAKSNEVFLGDATDNVNFCAQSISFSFANENTQVLCVGAETGVDANFFQGREITVSITGKLDQYDANMINKFLNNTELRFMYNVGEKSGGNWVAGKCASLYLPSCTVSSYAVEDLDGLVGIAIELTGFVDSNGNGEVYLNFL
jgi:hypothetical protein